jgi:hypothetical protein
MYAPEYLKIYNPSILTHNVREIKLTQENHNGYNSYILYFTFIQNENAWTFWQWSESTAAAVDSAAVVIRGI